MTAATRAFRILGFGSSLPLAVLAGFVGSITCTLFSAAAIAQAVLSIDPTTQTTSTGTVVTVDVDVGDVTNLYSYQFDLTFNPSTLQAVSSSEGWFLSSGGSTYFIPGNNDNVGGTVAATADTLVTAVSGVSGSGELAAFQFDAIGNGTSAIGIQNELLLDSNLNIISDTTSGGSVSVVSGSGPTKAPEIDPGSAVNAILLLLGILLVLAESARHPRKEAFQFKVRENSRDIPWVKMDPEWSSLEHFASATPLRTSHLTTRTVGEAHHE